MVNQQQATHEIARQYRVQDQTVRDLFRSDQYVQVCAAGREGKIWATSRRGLATPQLTITILAKTASAAAHSASTKLPASGSFWRRRLIP
jgi:hypothetical protein